MKIKALLLAAIMLLSAFSFASCVNKDQVVMATNAAFPPFEYTEGTEIIGIDIEIAKAIAQELGKTLKIEDMEFQSVLTALPSGKADFAIAGMTVNDERKETMDFSETYFVAEQNILVKTDSTVANANDLKDLKVGVIQGYTGEEICRDTLKISKLDSYMSSTEAIAALKQGKVDAVVIDSYTAEVFEMKNSELKIVKDETVFESEEYAVAVKKGNTELLETINKVIKKLKEEGKIEQFAKTHSEKLIDSVN